MAKKNITPTSVATNNIQSQPDQVKNQATALKLSYDQYGIDNNDYLNNILIPLLESATSGTSGSYAIGHGSASITANNVGDALEENRVAIDSLETADTQNVKLTGNQTIAGTKTFSSLPVIPVTPTLTTHPASKGYVDSQSPLTIPNNSLTELKMAADMKKQAGGVATYEMGLTPKQAGGGYLINGDFQVWQRGTSFNPSVNGGYTADRKKTSNIVDSNSRIDREIGVLDGFEYSIRVEQINTTGVAGSETRIGEIIEDFEKFKGKQVTFSTKVLIDSGASAILLIEDGIGFQLGINTPGDGTVKDLELTYTVNSSATVLLASVVLIRDGLLVGNGMNIQTMKLELGDKTTEFIPKMFAEELRECQRYYRVLTTPTTTVDRIGNGMANSTTIARVFRYLEEPMRASPTVINSGNFALVSATFGVLPITNIVTFVSEKFVEFQLTVASGLVAGDATMMFTNADANAVIALDAEL